MNASSSQPSVVDHRIELLRRQWRHRPQSLEHLVSQPKPKQLATIAISREAGAPGVEIGEAAGERLGWPVYDREVLEMIAQKAGLRAELLESMDEHDPNWLVDALAGLGTAAALHSASYVHHLIRVVAALAARGGCIIVGRGATALLPPSTTLRVRVVADYKDRIARSARKFKLTTAEAAERVKRVDYERRHFVANHFHRDVADSHNFDLVLNASRLDVPTCASLIVTAASKMAIEQEAVAKA
jgi:hypothetical protein